MLKEKLHGSKSWKRRALADEVHVNQLKRKKQKLDTDGDSLAAAAAKFAEQAEKKHQVTLIAKSNVLQKSAREKETELKAVDEQLHDTLLQLSNCQ